MTVEVLDLSGLSGGDAGQAASALLADYGSHPDLTRLLVIDDTVALLGHSVVYECLLTSHRLDHLLCVAVGQRARYSREFLVPGNIGSGQGSAVLWVSDPEGIDWRLTPAANAVGHSGNSMSGLRYLVDLLSVDEVFDRVCEIARQVPGGVASPGIRLAGADDEAASFAAALVAAIRRITAADPGLGAKADEPFAVLPDRLAATVRLTENGELSLYREEVIASAASASDALTRWKDTGGLLGLSRPGVQAHVIDVGAALGTLRDRVARLLRDAHAPGGLTEKQRGQLTAAGVRLPGPPPAVSGSATGAGPGGAAGTGVGRSPAYEAIAEAIRDGDSLPRVARRLNLTANTLNHGGSASYLPEVDQICPPALLRQLTGPPSPPRPRRWWLPAAVVLAAALGAIAGQGNAVAGVAVGVLALVIMGAAAAWIWRSRIGAWRRELALDQAVHAADALVGLVTTVAAREWSGTNVTADEIARARIALNGVAKQLIEHADATVDPGTGARPSRASRLSDNLMPGLRDLVLAGLAAGSAAVAGGGQAAFEQARVKTRELLTEWAASVHKHGALARPRFASFPANDVPYADESEIAEITEAVQRDPREMMWQLCTPADLSALDVAGVTQVVAFAPRLNKQPLADVLPPDTVWTSSGAHAGLLRLVPLRAGVASTSWTADKQHPPEPPR